MGSAWIFCFSANTPKRKRLTPLCYMERKLLLKRHSVLKSHWGLRLRLLGATMGPLSLQRADGHPVIAVGIQDRSPPPQV